MNFIDNTSPTVQYSSLNEVCLFGGVSGVSGASATRMWLGEYPQLCVLQKVHGTRIGGDGNQIIGMGVNGSPLNPIIYNLKLIFVELEPVYRNATDTISRSRSQFIQ